MSSRRRDGLGAWDAGVQEFSGRGLRMIGRAAMDAVRPQRLEKEA